MVLCLFGHQQYLCFFTPIYSWAGPQWPQSSSQEVSDRLWEATDGLHFKSLFHFFLLQEISFFWWSGCMWLVYCHRISIKHIILSRNGVMTILPYWPLADDLWNKTNQFHNPCLHPPIPLSLSDRPCLKSLCACLWLFRACLKPLESLSEVTEGLLRSKWGWEILPKP